MIRRHMLDIDDLCPGLIASCTACDGLGYLRGVTGAGIIGQDDEALCAIPCATLPG
ncbi:MAG: hypothetical protein ABJ263_08140 [Tateyamaria sp.]|uniref:hypothetical protein n=1 Tax=Tateyamaria sp. TaxID=1929288 RepID=UPI003287172B